MASAVAEEATRWNTAMRLVGHSPPRCACRIKSDAMDEPIWNGAYKNDEWYPWFLKRIRALIAAPRDA
ncbi:hypothetical protein GCM10010403_35040 [Glycomyces rutgersensis]